MNSFVKDIVLNNISFQFHFNEYYSPRGTRYFVYVITGNGNSFSFNMERINSDWRIIDAPKLPDYFMCNEKKISDAINDYLKNSA